MAHTVPKHLLMWTFCDDDDVDDDDDDVSLSCPESRFTTDATTTRNSNKK